AKEMLKNYKRLAFINTGNYDITKWKEIAKKEADKYGLRFEEIKGSNKLLSKIINCNWDEQFIIVKPGVKITPEMFGSL
ncbi:MAG: DUF1638 domain-containing protein, partial [Actinobacteria bacterium]|nr:DUF1638 domain-containing protein [Actinomycetota bacterium]